MNKILKICKLCQSTEINLLDLKLIRNFYRCHNCYLVFVDEKHLPSVTVEKNRYDHHKNDIQDVGYTQFLHQLIEPILLLIKSDDIGLDYGCGPTAVLSKIMERHDVQMHNYDPIYYPIVPKINYNFIMSTEVVEHFHNVRSEWIKLLSNLKENGILGIMTHLWTDKTDFDNWYYSRDITHTAFYHVKTIEFIANEFHFSICEIINDRVIIFKR
jgi:Methyltransferase domain